MKLHVRYLVQTWQSVAIRTDSANSDTDLSGSLQQQAHKIDTANAVFGQQEVHFTKQIISMLKTGFNVQLRIKRNFRCTLLNSSDNPFTAKILLSFIYSSYLPDHFHIFSSIPIWLVHFMKRLCKLLWGILHPCNATERGTCNNKLHETVAKSLFWPTCTYSIMFRV